MLIRRNPERGFTLIEMIISMIIFAVLIGVIFPLVSELTRNGSRESTRSAAAGDARLNAQMLESDLRAMRAPLRPTGDGEDVVNIVAALNRGSGSLPLPAASWPGTPTSTLWGERTTSDLLFAGSTTLSFWADVMDNPAGAFQTELVRWYLLVGTEADASCPSGTDWCMVREVRYALNANASASRAIREVLSSGVGAIPPSQACYSGAAVAANPQANPRVFCFQSQVPNAYTWNTWNRASCRSRWVGLSPDPNALTGSTPVRLSAVSGTPRRPGISQANGLLRVDHEQAGPLFNVRIHPLDRITTIGAMMPGGGAANGATDVAIANAETSIPSRQSSEYRTAILCGNR